MNDQAVCPRDPFFEFTITPLCEYLGLDEDEIEAVRNYHRAKIQEMLDRIKAENRKDEEPA